MKQMLRSLLVLLALGGWLVSPVYAHGSGLKSYPNMAAAVSSLQGALTSSDPLPLLKDARKSLEKAKANEGGHKKDAIAAVDEAIKLLPTGDKNKIESKINEAVFYINASMKRR